VVSGQSVKAFDSRRSTSAAAPEFTASAQASVASDSLKLMSRLSAPGAVFTSSSTAAWRALPERFGWLHALAQQRLGNSPITASALWPIRDGAPEPGDRVGVPLLSQKYVPQLALAERLQSSFLLHEETPPKARLRLLRSAEIQKGRPAEEQVGPGLRL